jgi:hypothetical protein
MEDENDIVWEDVPDDIIWDAPMTDGVIGKATQADNIGLLSVKNDTPVDDTLFEKGKAITYLEGAGYKMESVAWDDFKTNVMGKDASWSAFNSTIKKY